MATDCNQFYSLVLSTIKTKIGMQTLVGRKLSHRRSHHRDWVAVATARWACISLILSLNETKLGMLVPCEIKYFSANK